MAQTKKTDKQDKVERIIKIGTFIIAIVAATTSLLTWCNNQKTSDPLKETRLKTYTSLSNLVGKMISPHNADSLAILAKTFTEDFYNGEMILVEDTTVSLAMKRFKIELNDKLNGVENILNPNKFENSGRVVIEICKFNIIEMTEKSKKQ